ncbi:response regulator [Luteibacter sp. dw_328]|jgi:DNA-binding NtrC family response regulator|uniref:response regulator n=1 Tax=Luteibacter sp. dw_328 TaxID=2719796 RepID=UPI001BD45C0B|nr:response regulator [Luteibacter sp. dw_328]
MTQDKPLFVLLVEDDPAIREISAMILEDAGMTVHTASSGDEAERWLETGKADVLFTDVRMPGGISGQELATRHADMNVLVTSGEAKEQHAWLQASMGYLAKPYDRKALLAALRDVAA